MRTMTSVVPNETEARWREARDRFLAAVAPEQRQLVAELLGQFPHGGQGLHRWLCALAWEGAFLPGSLPPELIATYLDDAEAVPLHDCADCGLAVPIRPGRTYGYEGLAARRYFPTCPHCGGKTGWYARWSNHRPLNPATTPEPAGIPPRRARSTPV